MPYSAILFFTGQFLLGLLAIGFFDKKKLLTMPEKIIGGVILGATFGFFIVLAFSLLLKSLGAGIIFGSFLEAAVIARNFKFFADFFRELFEKIKNRESLAPLFSIRAFFGLAVFALLIFAWLAIALGVLIEESTQIKGILVGWGDVAYHLSMIERFAAANSFAIEQPIFAGAPLTYPFLINFASAVLLKLGFGVFWAFHLPVIILGASGILFLFLTAFRIFKSTWLASAIIGLVLLGSGLGFLQFFEDVKNISAVSANPVIETLQNPPHEYTHLDNRTGGKPNGFDSPQNIVWIAPAISFLSHQRSFVWGFALFTVLFRLLWLYRNDKSLWKIGAAFGLLPFIHGHTFLAMAIASAGWLLGAKNNRKSWFWLALAALIVALPFLAFLNQNMQFLGQNSGQGFFRWQLGWMTCEHAASWLDCVPKAGTDKNIFVFWSKNFGITFWIWLAFAVFSAFGSIKYALKKKQEALFPESGAQNFLKWLLPSSILLFILPNLLIFQPWEFDNNKVFYYWWIMASFVVVGSLDYLIQNAKNQYWKAGIRIAAILLIFFGLFSGAIDAGSRIFNFSKNHFGYWSAPQEKMAEWVKKNTPADAIFLSSPSPNNPLAMIAGRRLYLGYTGWLWTQGINYAEKQKNIGQILKNRNTALACGEKIDYILLDNGLAESYRADAGFLKTLPVVYQDTDNGIFLIKLECPR